MKAKKGNIDKRKDHEWNFIKIPFMVIVSILYFKVTIDVNSISINRGICELINCYWFLSSWIKYTLCILFSILAILYVTENKMIFTTLSISILLFISFSLHESYGVQLRTGILPLIFLVQSIAYFLNRKKIKKEQLKDDVISFSVQTIVACYTLAGISKVVEGGFGWISDSKYIVLQMLKSNQTHFFDERLPQSEIFSSKIDFVLDNPVVVSVLLLGALLIELTCALAMVNKRTRVIYGILLLSIHIGIWYLFNIIIVSFVVPMVLFMINPLWLGYKKLRSKYNVSAID